jgi:prepilin-type N-terminal cleavage/methylation domain-containing protein
MKKNGFTLVELIVSVVILGTAILGLSSSTARLTRVALDAEKNALALQACEDRIARIRLHPIYPELDSLYTESGTPVVGLEGFSRTTQITRVIEDGEREGKFVDFTRVTVLVSGPTLGKPVSRTVTIGKS